MMFLLNITRKYPDGKLASAGVFLTKLISGLMFFENSHLL